VPADRVQRHLAANAVKVRSTGSKPPDEISSPAAVEAMSEVGIDIADQTQRS
jgi:protein-tyrosine-phosphatase